ncbi:MAG: Na/Pi cotransporter family protein, partial [Leucothrix sp.]
MELLIQLLGSIALLLWGLRMVRTGIMRAYGTSLKRLAQQAEGRVLPSFASGLLIAALLQSSTATALIAATFSGQGVISVVASFITILGADVGTAVAVLLASQKVSFISPLLLFVGIFGFLSFSRSKPKNVFRAIAGLGMILLALSLISSTAKNLATFDDFITVVRVLEMQSVFLLLFALGLTYLAHSSLAVVLLAMGFVTSGLVGIEGGLVLVLGANLGSGLLPVLSNWNAHRDARIPVIANLLIRGAAVFAVLPLIAVVIEQAAVFIDQTLIPLFPQGQEGLFSARFAPAAFHLCLNLVVAIIGIILAKPLIALVDSLVPAMNIEEDDSKPKHLDFNNMSSPAVCLACAKRETLNMANIVQKMLNLSYPVLRDNDREQLSNVVRMDDSVDGLYVEIKLYIAQILQEELTQEESQKALDLLSFTTNMEHIGDIVDGGLMT